MQCFPVSECAQLDYFHILLDLFSIFFFLRSQSDWEENWHKEKFTRCRETLIRHLYWACEKDIYRLTRRSDPQTNFNYVNDYDEGNLCFYIFFLIIFFLDFPWLTPKKAKRLLRFRRGINRRTGASITAECCKSSGCTWEEYAEYCPTNKRYTSYV